ncbi:tyrosine--tRNA ligase [Acidilobus sp. 7A]|uniref:tyrosine--tRNA ligase n=1 Tax=Acidilobus sp. 7A TaxID=1577685 RepID=UPI000764D3EF|nr:tyrosyl-tRNA synthetase [Acidilobus sp. 7A]
MDVEERLSLITRNLVEVITYDELREKVNSGVKLKGYIGYEPSGLAHIGHLIWMFKVKDLVEAGVEFNVLEATWHAMINDKLGGNVELIRRAAVLFREIMRSLGVPVERVNFVDAESMASDKDYWALVLKVMKMTSLARMKRALTIMGRTVDEAELDSSKLVYPAMQVSDIIYMDLDIALGGLDQRKAHVLQREVAERLGKKKVIAIHTPILTGLEGGKRMDNAESDEQAAAFKMSKSKASSAIFLNDSPEQVRAKIRAAYCPPRQVELNPVIEIAKYILFSRPGFVLHVERPTKYGGPVDFASYAELERAYVEGRLHPLDLKEAVADALNTLLEAPRKLFERPDIAELVSEVESKVSR